MAADQDARQRAVICQDCWFWKEMSCALPNPVADVCANRRPVRGRVTAVAPVQVVPFAANAPEATFSIAQVRAETEPVSIARPAAPLELFEQPVRVAPPSFRDIRAGRAAAAMRPSNEATAVVIPLAELEAQPMLAEEPTSTPDYEQLRERVRQRAAARLARASALV